MACSELLLRANVEQDNVAAREPLPKFDHGDVLEILPLTEILVGEDAHLGDEADGGVSDRTPKVADGVAGKSLVDARSVPARADKTRARQHLKVLRRVRRALTYLSRDLVDRTFCLREQVDDLCAAATAECLGDGSHRIEQRPLGQVGTHMIKLSRDDLKSKYRCSIPTP